MNPPIFEGVDTLFLFERLFGGGWIVHTASSLEKAKVLADDRESDSQSEFCIIFDPESLYLQAKNKDGGIVSFEINQN